jgi:hypothetical protein
MQSTTGRYRVLLAVVGVIALAVLAGAVVLWPRGELARPAGAVRLTRRGLTRPP